MKFMAAGVPFLIAIASICIFSSSLPAGAPGLKLMVSQFPDGKNLILVDLDQEKGFALSFIHSVSKTRVTDIYRVENGRIIQTAERFSAHGAGLPSQADEPGGICWEKKGDEFLLTMERPIPQMVIRTDKHYENRLMIGRRVINLNQWEDQALRLYIKTD